MSSPSPDGIRRFRTAALWVAIAVEGVALAPIVALYYEHWHKLVRSWTQRGGAPFNSLFVLFPWFLLMLLVRLLFVLVELPRWTQRCSTAETGPSDSPRDAPSRRKGLARLTPKHREPWLIASAFVTIAALYWNYLFCAVMDAFASGIAH